MSRPLDGGYIPMSRNMEAVLVQILKDSFNQNGTKIGDDAILSAARDIVQSKQVSLAPLRERPLYKY
ncbi:MAG: hypothetical protein HY052_09095 [Proteobacteria bacterium]|nr:hypothetical protein [Pseudomonadota bacterium]